MAYITQTDLINRRVNINAPKSDIQIVADLIKEDRNSAEKQELKKSQRYYEVKHDILDRKITYLVDGQVYENKDATNNKIQNPFHKIITDQKVSYIVGNPIVVNIPDKSFSDAVAPFLGDLFNDKMNQWIKGASNYGRQYLHWYVKDDGSLNYLIMDAVQIIPIYDTQYQNELMEVIRYYSVEYITKDGVVNLTAVEWWTAENVTFYIDNGDGKFHLDSDKPMNPMPHWIVRNSANPDIMKEGNWGRVPFIILKNNDECIPDLRLYKTLIDDYDFNISESSNKLADIEEAIMILKGYEGTSLSEFRKNLKMYRAINVDSTDNSGVDPISNDLNMDSREKHLDRLEENIFTFGMAVNPKNKDFGTSSGIALKYLYALLDLKSGMLIRKMKFSLKDFFEFLRIWFEKTENKKYKTDGIEFIFNESLIINETEAIANVSASTGVISDETRLSHHPWVDDVDKEKERIKNEGGLGPNLDGDPNAGQ